jgi:hypothetical protein
VGIGKKEGIKNKIGKKMLTLLVVLICKGSVIARISKVTE